MPVYADQLGNLIELKETPSRIISLVPSQTELLYDLGLDNQVIGITKFCIHPEIWFLNKTRVGGTKKLHLDKIQELEPDLIIANKEENEKAQIEELQKHFSVWISDITTLDDALSMINSLGEITYTEEKATEIITQIKSGFSELKPLSPRLSAAYLIWQNPFMTIGKDTFIHQMMEKCGLQNCFANDERYPEISIDNIKSADPDLLLLSSEPFPFKENHCQELQQELPNTKVVLVDGEMFSWYGSRLTKAPSYFARLLKELQ